MRKAYIDVVKGIGIFFCLLGHICDRHGIMGPVNFFITCFDMPLFFITFGMVAFKFPLPNFKTILSKRIKGLLLPYFLWAAIWCSCWTEKTWFLFLFGSNPALSKAGSSAMLWFLPTIFLSSIIAYFLFLGEKKVEFF